MNDRQFLRLMAIVVATGLVLGLVAFRASRGADSPANVIRPATTVQTADGAPAPSADQGDASPEQSAAGGNVVAAIEPPPPPQNPPPMVGAANIDPPGIAITNQPQGAPVSSGESSPASQ